MNKFVAKYSIDVRTPVGLVTQFYEAEISAPNVVDAFQEIRDFFKENEVSDPTIYSVDQVPVTPGVISNNFIYSKALLKKEA